MSSNKSNPDNTAQPNQTSQTPGTRDPNWWHNLFSTPTESSPRASPNDSQGSGQMSREMAQVRHILITVGTRAVMSMMVGYATYLAYRYWNWNSKPKGGRSQGSGQRFRGQGGDGEFGEVFGSPQSQRSLGDSLQYAYDGVEGKFEGKLDSKIDRELDTRRVTIRNFLRFEDENGTVRYGEDLGDGVARLIQGSPLTGYQVCSTLIPFSRRLAPLEPSMILLHHNIDENPGNEVRDLAEVVYEKPRSQARGVYPNNSDHQRHQVQKHPHDNYGHHGQLGRACGVGLGAGGLGGVGAGGLGGLVGSGLGGLGGPGPLGAVGSVGGEYPIFRISELKRELGKQYGENGGYGERVENEADRFGRASTPTPIYNPNTNDAKTRLSQDGDSKRCRLEQHLTPIRNTRNTTNTSTSVLQTPPYPRDVQVAPYFPLRQLNVLAPRTLIGPDDNLVIPRGSLGVAFGHLGVVIGTDCKNVTPRDAMEYVLGFTVCLHLQLISRERRTRFERRGLVPGLGLGQPVLLNADATCCAGPTIVPRDRVLTSRIRVSLTLNNEEILQEFHIDQLGIPVPELISRLSRRTTLPKGTLLLTGSNTQPANRSERPESSERPERSQRSAQVSLGP
ncbi:hypothetical protein AAMO2058_000341800 [Amorphochlora amoebiformis]